MHRRLGSSLLLFAVFSCSLIAADAADWNQFRGPTADGHAQSKKLPIEWNETKNVAWKVAIPGKAWSSPVVLGNQIWLSNATEDGKKLSAVCVDANFGKIVHDVVVFEIEKPMFCYPYNSYASGTPVADNGRVWVHFGSAGTACLEASTAKTIWSRQDLPCDHHRGPGSSPILFEDLFIVNFDGFDQQYVVALDKSTGKTVWKRDRDIKYGTDNGDVKKSYSTPTVITHEGRTQMIDPSSIATISYNPRTGEEFWKVYHGGFNAAARPLYGHGLVFINLEGGDRLLAVKPDGTGDVTKTHVAWKCMKQTPTRPSQLVIGDRYWMVSDNGVVSNVDIKSGVPVWTHRMEGRHCGSPIFAPAENGPGRIYFFDEDGRARVIEANDAEYKELADNKLDAGFMASPAVHGDALILRTKTHLYRIATPESASK